MVSPDRTFLVLHPGNDEAVLEYKPDLPPSKRPDENYKTNFNKFIYQNHFVSESDYLSKTTDELFRENFERIRSVTLMQFAAIQYLKYGVGMFEKQAWPQAAAAAEKAHVLFPDYPVGAFYHNQALANFFDYQISNKIYSGKLLGRLLNYNHQNTAFQQNALQVFLGIINDKLLENSDWEGTNHYYHDFLETVDDSINIDEFKRQSFWAAR